MSPPGDIQLGARLARYGLGYYPLIEDADLPGVRQGTLIVDDPDTPTHVGWYAVVGAAPLTGLVTITNGSVAVTGAGTAFITEAPATKAIKVTADHRWAPVSVVGSDVALTLAAAYQDAGGAGVAASAATLIPEWTADITYGLDGNPSAVAVTQYQSGAACTPIVTLLYWDADGNLLNADRA